MDLKIGLDHLELLTDQLLPELLLASQNFEKAKYQYQHMI